MAVVRLGEDILPLRILQRMVRLTNARNARLLRRLLYWNWLLSISEEFALFLLLLLGILEIVVGAEDLSLRTRRLVSH